MGVWLASVGAGLGLLLVLAACAPSRPAAPTARAGATALEQRLIEAVQRAGESEVIWWTTASIDEKRVMQPFEARYPFLKVRQEVVCPSQGSTRLIEEAKTGVSSVDVVFWVAPAMVVLKEVDLLAEVEWPPLQGWENQPEHNYWRALGINPWAPVLINTQVLPEAEWPRNVDAMRDAKYKGKVVASTSGETVILENAEFWKKDEQTLDWDRATQFWTEVVRNTEPAVTRGFEAPMERFSAGESSLFVHAPLSNAVVLMSRGAKFALPREIETIRGYNESIAVLKNARNPNGSG